MQFWGCGCVSGVVFSYGRVWRFDERDARLDFCDPDAKVNGYCGLFARINFPFHNECLCGCVWVFYEFLLY